MIDKIDEQNTQSEGMPPIITEKNFQTGIGDLIGIRFICLRLSDIEKVAEYLNLLVDEKILRFINGPDKKRSFVLPIDPDDTILENFDLQYSGYSSIHYLVELGEKSDAAGEFEGIRFEFQLRTILEEAWGEIDHKYRYAISRNGIALPGYIHTGFYNLSAYLQVAAMQAEFLCRQADAHQLLVLRKTKENIDSSEDNESVRSNSLNDFKIVLEEKFGFQMTVRTFAYIRKRLDETWNVEEPQMHFLNIFTEEKLKVFKTIFREILNREAFEDSKKRNIDVINAVNFILFDKTHGAKVAQVELKSVLKWRAV